MSIKSELENTNSVILFSGQDLARGIAFQAYFEPKRRLMFVAVSGGGFEEFETFKMNRFGKLAADEIKALGIADRLSDLIDKAMLEREAETATAYQKQMEAASGDAL